MDTDIARLLVDGCRLLYDGGCGRLRDARGFSSLRTFVKRLQAVLLGIA
jgi:hypothetical protein